ncbi:MAG: pentapeptide repeat-containing protein, partial [Candidatus Tectomicrobia bacterium]|nr:pentapeptide repeat-containing protein [Candidatus Tectomicrobia bacterium]
MANPDHLNQLLRARASEHIWNDWREANPYTQPDLSDLNQSDDSLVNAKLQNLNLQDVIFINTNLQEADLSGSTLEGADLSGAQLDNAILSGVNLKGAKLNGATLQGTLLQEADLSHAEMKAVNLTGAELTNAVLNGAKLNKAKLNGTKLKNAHLHDVDLSDAEMEDVDLSDARLEASNLSRAKLNRAKLDKVTFKETQLRASVLREASLEQAHLVDVLGLSEEQLAGTNLKDAELPPEVQPGRIHLFDDKLNRIESASQNLQTLFFGLLASCIYCWLTIASTTHAQLIADSATSPLPIIGAKVSIINFYRVMPFFLLIFYIYFHLNLQRLWDMLASLPAVFPDGTRLDERSHPRHVSGFVRARCFLLKERSSPGDCLYGCLFILLTWFNVPITLFVFWWSFLPRRDLQGDIVTVVLTILITMTVAFGLWSYQRAVSVLQTKHQLPQDGPTLFKRKLQEYLVKYQIETWITRFLIQIDRRAKYLDKCIAFFLLFLVVTVFISLFFSPVITMLLAFILLTILVSIRIFQQCLMEKWWKWRHPSHNTSNDRVTQVSTNTWLIPVIASILSLIFLIKINLQPTCFLAKQDDAGNMPERMQERRFLNYLFCYPIADLNRQNMSTKAPNWPGVSLEGNKGEDDRGKG